MRQIKINTKDSGDYHYFPIKKHQVCLSIKAANDARIALRTHLGRDSNVYEIIIGGWGNTMSAIKRNHVDPDIAEADTRDVLSAEEMRHFWIKWSYQGFMMVAHANDVVLLSFKDEDPFDINYLGVSTAWGATGEWIIRDCQLNSLTIREQLEDTNRYWIDYNASFGLLQNAVIASEDGLFVGRMQHRQALTPGGVKNGICTIAWGGAAHRKTNFQLLCGGNVKWVKSWAGSVPLCALPAGITEDGFALFIGRVFLENMYYVGKVQPEHQVCYIALDGSERAFSQYEVLTVEDYTLKELVDR